MAAERDNLFKRGETFYLRQRVNGKLIIQSLKVKTITEAKAKRKDLLESSRDVKTESDVIIKTARARQLYNPIKFLLRNIIKAFETHPSWKKPSEQTMQCYRHWIKEFIDWAEKNHPEANYLSAITPDISKEYSIALYQTGISNKTYNEVLNCLARVFEILKDEAGITRNPFMKDVIARLSKEVISRKELSREQVNSLLNRFKEIKGIPHINEYELLFYIGIYTGVRLKDACLLKWEDVNFGQNLISIEPYKTQRYGTKVKIPISQWLLQKLQETKQVYVNEYVLPNISSSYLGNRYGVNLNIRKIFEYNEFPSATKTPSVQRKYSASLYSFHSLRYCFVSFCAEAGIPQVLVQAVVGHLNPAMTEHYTKTSNEFNQKEFKKFNLFLPSAEPTLRETVLKLLETASEATLKRMYAILKEEV